MKKIWVKIETYLGFVQGGPPRQPDRLNFTDLGKRFCLVGEKDLHESTSNIWYILGNMGEIW